MSETTNGKTRSMDRFTLSLRTTTDAFGNGDYAGDMDTELARILRAVADQIDNGETSQGHTIRDINGNAVGAYYFD